MSDLLFSWKDVEMSKIQIKVEKKVGSEYVRLD